MYNSLARASTSAFTHSMTLHSAKLVMSILCSERKIKLISYLTIFAEPFDTRSATAEEVLSSVMKVGGSILTQSSTTAR